jgi:type II secretory pathway component PulF
MKKINYSFVKWQFRRDVSGRKRLWRKIETLLSNGVQLREALSELRDRRKRMSGKNHPSMTAFSAWIRGIDEGDFMAEINNGWIQKDETMLLTAGQESGNLEGALSSIIKVVNSKIAIKKAIVSGVSYPLALVLFIFGALYLFGTVVIPKFVETAPNANWVGMADTVVNLSFFTQNYLGYVAMVLISLLAAFFYSLPHWNSKTRVILDRYPPYSIYRTVQGASFLIALSALVDAGMRLEDALERLKHDSTPWMKVRIQGALNGIRSGDSLGDALLKSGYEFPDREIIDDLGVYSGLSGFEKALIIIGEEWMDEAIDKIKASMGVVFKVGIVAVGGVLVVLLSGLFALQEQLQMALTTPM